MALARAALPGMVTRKRGVFICVSSTGGPFMASYEVIKAAQVDLASALDQELEGTGVVAFTIGPGLVPTETAIAGVKLVAPRLGLTVPEFYAMNSAACLSVEAAGAGFAAAVANAERYGGQEISCTQALLDAGIEITDEGALPPGVELPKQKPAEKEGRHPAGRAAAKKAITDPNRSEASADAGTSLVELTAAVWSTLAEQSAGWRDRPFFESQWMVRDFKQRAGMPAERWLEMLDRLSNELAADELAVVRSERPPLEKLAAYWEHLAELARGYVKDPVERDQQVAICMGWRAEVERLIHALDRA